MNACRQCHEDKYESFIRTGMGLSFDTATLEKTSARFDHAPVYDRYKNFYYKPFWYGDSLFLLEFRLDGIDTVFKRLELVSYIIGSGQHTNSHLVHDNGYVFQAPLTYYTQSGKWDLPPGFESGFNSRFSRKIELECMSCHNAYPKMVPGSENKYEHIPVGIDCERCHGPGSEHIRQIQSGSIIDVGKEIDYSIVNPAKLPVELQLDVCQRCHIQGNAVLKEGKSFFDFRPGMSLSDVMDVYMPVYKGEEHTHIMASHVERMKLSACFIQSKSKAEAVNPNKSALYPYKNAMTCVTCHNPHVSVLETGTEQYNNACISCHPSDPGKPKLVNEVALSRLACTEDLKARMDASDNCSNCHMPKNGTIDIPHVSTTDHFIRKPVKAEQIERIREFVTLACINNREPGRISRGIAFLNYFEKFEPRSYYLLDSAKKYFPDGTTEEVISNFQYLVRWAFLKNDLALIVKYEERMPDLLLRPGRMSFSNEDAWTSYRVGEAYMEAGDRQRAIAFFQHAVDLAPYTMDFRNKLALAQLGASLYEAARKNLEFIIGENPGYASAYVRLGYLVLSVDQDLKKADHFYDRALSLDPDHEQALFNKAGTLVYQKRNGEAIKLLERLLARNPGHLQGKSLLKSLKAG